MESQGRAGLRDEFGVRYAYGCIICKEFHRPRRWHPSGGFETWVDVPSRGLDGAVIVPAGVNVRLDCGHLMRVDVGT